MQLAFDSTCELAVAPAALWATVSTMAGVNAELAPWMRMTTPSEAVGRSLSEAPIGEPMFASWLLAFGVLPIDLHQLTLERVWRGEADAAGPRWGFFERSRSWMQREWVHERVIRASSTGSALRDRVWVEPRFAPLTPVVCIIVQRLFAHRHRRLLANFGN